MSPVGLRDTDAVVIAAEFALGPNARMTGPVARGELGQVWRLDTDRGPWAVKETFDHVSEGDVVLAAEFQERAVVSGVPAPHIVRTIDGAVLATVGDATARVFTWVDLLPVHAPLDPELVGRTLAALHRIDVPTSDDEHPWFSDPVGAARWLELVDLLTAAGAEFADALAGYAQMAIDLESLLPPPRPTQICHLDLWPENLRGRAAASGGGVCVIDWENAGPGDPSQELAMVLFGFGRPDARRARTLLHGYARRWARTAGRTGVIRHGGGPARAYRRVPDAPVAGGEPGLRSARAGRGRHPRSPGRSPLDAGDRGAARGGRLTSGSRWGSRWGRARGATIDFSVVSVAVQVDGVVRRYGSTVALDEMTWQAPEGKVTAILGPNGAGKTSVIDILVGLQRADAGTARVLGVDPCTASAEHRASVGVMLQSGGLPNGARAMGLLAHLARFYADPAPIDPLARRLGIPEFGRTSVRRLSGGQRQRLALAAALIGRPRLVFLDEPTAGLDPHGRLDVWDLIASLRTDGLTVVVTTHSFQEAERLADHLVIVAEGRTRSSGTFEEVVGESTLESTYFDLTRRSAS